MFLIIIAFVFTPPKHDSAMFSDPKLTESVHRDPST